MEMNKNAPIFPTYRGSPFIETPVIEVPLYLQGVTKVLSPWNIYQNLESTSLNGAIHYYNSIQCYIPCFYSYLRCKLPSPLKYLTYISGMLIFYSFELNFWEIIFADICIPPLLN